MRLRVVVPALTVAISLTRAALAQAPGTAPPTPARPAVEPADDKSPGVAMGLALGGTALPIAAFFAAGDGDDGALVLVGLGALIIGPSMGHFYAGETQTGLVHAGVRAGSMGLMLAGAIALLDECGWEGESECNETPGTMMLVGGGILLVGSTIYSIIDAPLAAHRHNRRAARFSLMPAPVSGPDRSVGLGLHLGATF